MTTEELHVGDYGTEFVVTIRSAHDNKIVDVSGATVKKILFYQPDGTVDQHTANFVTDGADGRIKYLTTDGDIDQAGELQYRGEVTLPSGHYESSTLRITVYSRWTT